MRPRRNILYVSTNLTIIKMGTDSLYKGCYVVIVHSNSAEDAYGRMVETYPTKEEALAHIKFQKERMSSTKHWSVLHIKDMDYVE